MDPIDWSNINNAIHQCHRALMVVWNRYRTAMHQRGIETGDATNEVVARVLANRYQFMARTPTNETSQQRICRFCGWTRRILFNWIMQELRRPQHRRMGSDLDASDSGEDPDYQNILRELTYRAALEQLPEHERILIALRYETQVEVADGKPRSPKPAEIRERLQSVYPTLWNAHQTEWLPDEQLEKACKAAKKHLNELAARIHRELNEDTPDGPAQS